MEGNVCFNIYQTKLSRFYLYFVRVNPALYFIIPLEILTLMCTTRQHKQLIKRNYILKKSTFPFYERVVLLVEMSDKEFHRIRSTGKRNPQNCELKMLCLYLDILGIGHTFCSMLTKLNEITLNKELQNFMINNVFMDQKEVKNNNNNNNNRTK